MKPKSSPTLRSGALAKIVGVSSDTLRLYERKRLLPAPHRASNGYRCYPQESVARVRLIRAALSIGFTLDELAKILEVRDAGGSPCHRVREMAAGKLQRLEEHIHHLLTLRDQLRNVLQTWNKILEHHPQKKPVGLLEALAAAPQMTRRLPAHLYSALTRETRR